MSYLEHFGLSSEPFSNAPVSRFYYSAPQHQQALQRLLYAVNSMKGMALLVGHIGAGKSTLARRLLDSMPEEEYEAALLVIIHSGITASWLLRRIALQLGVENPAQEKLALLSQLYQRLLQIYEQGRKAVVLIDEAQMLETRELMEEFRGLLNLEVPERKLISFVFFGLPEIERNLKLDPPLAQRVAMRYRLEPFTSESTDAYIKHRLRLAGSTHGLFTPAAVEAVHRRSGGTPRVINTLCDNALFETFLSREREIDAPLIEQIADNLGLEYGAVEPAPPVAVAPPPAPAVPVEPPPVVAVPREAPVAPRVAAEPSPLAAALAGAGAASSSPAAPRQAAPAPAPAPARPAAAGPVSPPRGVPVGPPAPASSGLGGGPPPAAASSATPPQAAGDAGVARVAAPGPGPVIPPAGASPPSVAPVQVPGGPSALASLAAAARAYSVAPSVAPAQPPAQAGGPPAAGTASAPTAQGPGAAPAPAAARPMVAGVPVNVLIRPGSPRPPSAEAPAAAGTPAEAPGTNATPGAPSKPRTGVDLAEIDRYLEGLGKL